MKVVKKSNRFEDIPDYDKEYWWSKTPEERLDAGLKLILYAKAIYRANPTNKPLENGNRIFRSDSPNERRRG